jgi:hypothetical protein
MGKVVCDMGEWKVGALEFFSKREGNFTKREKTEKRT